MPITRSREGLVIGVLLQCDEEVGPSSSLWAVLVLGWEGFAGGRPRIYYGPRFLGEGGKAWTDYLRSKESQSENVQKMFRNLQATGKPNTVDVPDTRARFRPVHKSCRSATSAFHGGQQGPKMPPEPFRVWVPVQAQGMTQAFGKQQAGRTCQNLTWGGPNPPYFEPAGAQGSPYGKRRLPPIQGVQQFAFPLPPGECASLQYPAGRHGLGEPPTPIAPPPEGGALPPIGGPGREGRLRKN